MQQRIYHGLTERVLKTKRVEVGHSWGHTTAYEKDGAERVTYDVFVDITELEAMAHKAAGNKSGKAKDGPLIVKITERKTLGVQA